MEKNPIFIEKLFSFREFKKKTTLDLSRNTINNSYLCCDQSQLPLSQIICTLTTNTSGLTNKGDN